jgi:dephospho-CoA kinase
MIILGLTGSIGMGKSTVAKMFVEQGVPVFDADAVVHALQGPGGALVQAIEAEFPGTTGDAGVNRTALAERVLGESERLQRLEALIHPAVAAEREGLLERHRSAPWWCSTYLAVRKRRVGQGRQDRRRLGCGGSAARAGAGAARHERGEVREDTGPANTGR